MATLFLSSGGDATGGLHEWTATSGSVSIATGAGQDGGSAILLDRTASDLTARVYQTGIVSYRLSLWFRFNQAPTTDSEIVVPSNSSGLSATTAGAVYLTTTGRIRVGSGGATSAVLATDTWHRLVQIFTLASGNTGSFTSTLFVNGASVGALSNSTGNTIASISFNSPFGASRTLHIDHVYIDDSTSAADPGDIRVTAHKPNALHVNTFGTIVGTGATRWARVSDIPLSTANGYTTNGTSQQETYGIEAAPAGATILAAKGWAWGQRVSGGGAPTYALFFDGTSYAATSSTSATFYNKVIDTATLPANVGFIKTAGSTNVNLWDTGVELAYQPSTGPAGPKGTLNRTQDAQAGSAAGTVSTTGNASRTQAAQSVASGGAVATSGNADRTQAGQSLASAASVAVAAGASGQQDAQALLAAGTVAEVGAIEGSLSAAQAGQFLAASGTTAVAGTLSATQAGQAVAGTIEVQAPVGPSSFLAFWMGGAGSAEAVVGTLASTQSPQALAAAGSVVATASLAGTQAPQTLVAAGSTVAGANASPAQSPQAVAASGTLTIAGTLSRAQGPDTLSAADGGSRGSLSLAQAPHGVAGTGSLSIVAAMARAQDAQSLAAAAAISTPTNPYYFRRYVLNRRVA